MEYKMKYFKDETGKVYQSESEEVIVSNVDLDGTMTILEVKEIDKKEYSEAIAKVEDQNKKDIEAANLKIKESYDQLIKDGLSEASAKIISGYKESKEV
jgi:hypothetical protein